MKWNQIDAITSEYDTKSWKFRLIWRTFFAIFTQRHEIWDCNAFEFLILSANCRTTIDSKILNFQILAFWKKLAFSIIVICGKSAKLSWKQRFSI